MTMTKLLTVDQYAEQFGTSRTTVFAWLKSGTLQEGVHYIRFGKILRFRWQEELLFPGTNTARKSRKPKRPTSPHRHAPSGPAAVNIDYGVQ